MPRSNGAPAFEHDFQLLTHRIRIESDSPDLHEVFGFLTNSCRQSIGVERTLRYAVTRVGEGVAVSNGGVDTAPGPSVAMSRLYTRMHHTVLGDLADAGWTRLHGGFVDVGGRGVLITGQPGAGKTTLCVRMLFDGADVGGDEYTMVRDGLAAAYPRRFHVRERTFDVIAELRPLRSSILAHRDETAPKDRLVTYAFDPRVAGCDWRSDMRKIDAVYYLTPNHGGTSAVRASSRHHMAMLLSSQSFTTEADGARVVADVSGVVAEAECYELEVGVPEEAAALIMAAP